MQRRPPGPFSQVPIRHKRAFCIADPSLFSINHHHGCLVLQEQLPKFLARAYSTGGVLGKLLGIASLRKWGEGERGCRARSRRRNSGLRRNFYKEFTTTEIGEPLPAATCYKAPPRIFHRRNPTLFFPVLVKPTPLPGIRTERNKTKKKNIPSGITNLPKITAPKKEYMIPTVPVIANTAPGKDSLGVVSLPLLLLIVTSRPDIPICSSAMVRHYPHILR